MEKASTNNLETRKNEQPVKLTKELMNQYQESLITRGCGKQTISMYSSYLNKLYEFLPGERELTDENLKQWIYVLRNEGYSDRTINLHISSINGLLRFCGRGKVPVSTISVPRSAEMPRLTREEYLKVLGYVKEHGSERDYLLIEVLATIDINVTELSFLTVEACQKGLVEFSNQRQAVIPESFRQELLSYIEKKGLSSGSVFITYTGNPLDRSNITHMIEKYGLEAGIGRGKVNPRSLHSLYVHTQEEITKHLMPFRMQEYEQLLNEEKGKVS